METEGIRISTAGIPGPTELTKPGRGRMVGNNSNHGKRKAKHDAA
jgi:hypothetical protein